MKKKYLLLIAISLLCLDLRAQQIAEDTIYTLSLEDLMNIPINVSKTDLTLRETPSVISVITRDEIRNMGARDLMDVLNQVPGFTFGIDVQNVIGIGARGNWGHEGKILLLIDGQEMNETSFSSTQFGQHYDIHNIDRIEIIRGPGSSIYGGYAELGVINIISRKGGDIKSASLEALYGTTGSATSRASVSFNAGNSTKNVEYSISGYAGQGIRSDQMYTDIYGNTVDLTNNSDLKPLMLNAGLKVGGFSTRLIYDQYSVSTVDQFDEILDPAKPDVLSFKQFFAEVKYDWKLSDKLTITPKINFKNGTPWKTKEDAVVPYLVDTRRVYPSLNVVWLPTSKTSVVAGVDSYFDHAKYTGSDVDYFGDFSDDNTLSFYNIGVFVQAIFKTNLANLTIGSRFDSHSQFGTAFSPRIGITKLYNKFHYKVLYSRAFRSPALENLNYNPNVKPEKTGVAELELGYTISRNMFITGNIYHIQISDPIVYFVDADNPIGTYDNFSKSGSMGFELDYRIKYNWGYVNINYSYYTSKGLNKVPYYQVPTDENRVLAMPGSRLNASSSINLGKSGLSLNPSLNLLGKRYMVSGLDVNDEYVYTELGSEFFLNLFLRYKNKNFDAGLGIYDIANEGQKFVQPYASGHLVMPGLGREFNVRLAYTIPFK